MTLALALVQTALVQTALFAQTDDPLRLAGDVVPVRQQVELKLDADQTAYTGSTSIELNVLRETGTFRLHAEEMTLESAVLTGAAGPVALTHEKGPGAIGLVTFKTQQPLTPGAYGLTLTFVNEFGTKATGLYRVQAGGLSYLFTQFEAEDAREAFPCFDEPDFKIPFRMTLIVPDRHVAVTNTPVESETKDEAGWRTVRFRETKPLPTYLIAIATGPMDVVPIPGMRVPGNVVTPKGQSALAARAIAYTPKILAEMEKWFGSPYPFEKLDLIAIPEYWPGAMENPGAITFRDLLLLFDDKTASTSQKRTLARVTAHELAHMWFGDVVTMKWWDDLWLNESFADWAGDKITDRVFPEFKVALSEMEDVQQIMGTDARPSTHAIRRPVMADTQKFEQLGVAYNKGKAVLSMFERWVGEENFRKGVLAYIEANKWDNATASDLWRSLSEVSGKELSPAMETFLVQNGIPAIKVEPLDGGRVRLTQQRFLNHGVTAEPREWRVPVTLRYPAGDLTQTTTVLLKDPSTVVELPGGRTPEWIFPDADGAGYYRWSIPPTMLNALSQNADRVLNARERIALLGNLSALLDAGAVSGDEYLRTLQQFAGDEDPQVVSYLTSLLDKVKLAFVPAEEEAAFAVYVRKTVGPALERFGMAPRSGEPEAVALLRPRLLAWMGNEGRDERVLDYAEEVAKQYMKNPTSVDPSLAGAALRLAAIRGDRALFDEYRRRAESPRTPDDRSRYLSACGFFREPELMKEALGMVTSGGVRANEMFGIITGLGDTASGRDMRYEYVVDNYDAIVGRLPGEMKAFMPMFAGGCEAGRLEQARAFFSDPSRKDPAIDRSVGRVADQVSDCVNLRNREGKSVAGYLGSLAGGM